MVSSGRDDSSEDEAPPLAVPLAVQSPEIREENHSAEAEEHSLARVPPPAVPVMLLTGYLGAGKTTLVNYILTAKHGYRCAVLLNEIGDSADIERALVREPEGREASALADWVQLENGCICCSVKSDMVQALEALLLQRDRFDYVLIETTGLANPGPVAASLWTDPQLESSVCLDAIVTVVDARNALRQLREPRPDGSVNEAQQQVAFADVILLNKVDLVGEAALRAVEAEIAAVNSEAAILRCERCRVDLGRILHTGMYSAAAVAAPSEALAPSQAAGGALEGGAHAASPREQPVAEGVADHEEEHAQEREHGEAACGPACAHHHDHDQSVRTVTLYLDRPLRLLRVRHWLDALLWERGEGAVRPEDVFRIKGLLSVEGSASKWVLQAVHELYDVTEGARWEAGGERRSKLVFIGRHLDRGTLLQGLWRCCAEAVE